ncbi:heme-binding domain-containing protein [Chitinophaga sp. Hz27]|uniref:heme-binding domain-containing protein n=1 Tax=Chitinophaga sp. Hz27 TaxID=3347169 RepID=UPI0035E30F77
MKTTNKIKITAMSAGIAVVVTAAMSFTTHVVNNPPITAEVNIPAPVKQIFQRACYDCHSNNTKLQWFDKLPVVAGIVKKDVQDARKHLNFSEWDKLSPAEQESMIWEAYNMIKAGNMPLPSYAALHSNAKVTADEMTVLRNYLDTKRKTVQPDCAQSAQTLPQVTNHGASAKAIPVAPTGIRFMPEFRQWQVMSTTSRFDNTTMRVMFANPIAMKAIKEKNISPWPDGAIVAKVVWEKQIDNDGNIHPGKFVNVQFMVRNQTQYESTDGWGYAKFETQELKPAGTLLTAQTCASCHKAANKTGGIFDLSTLN